MNTFLFLGFLTLGVGFQAINILQRKITKSNAIGLVSIIVFSSLSFLPSKNEKNYEPTFHLFAFLMMFCGLFGIVFRKEILPKVNERTLLFFTVIFWYAYLSAIGPYYILFLWPTWIAFIPTSAVIYSVLKTEEFSFLIKLMFYIWYLIIIFSLSCLLFSQAILPALSSPETTSMKPYEGFFYGGTFLYFISHLVYLVQLLPIPGKRETFETRIKEWKTYLIELVGKHRDDEMPFSESIVSLSVLLAVCSLNYTLKIVPEGILISTLILILSITNRPEKKRNQQKQS